MTLFSLQDHFSPKEIEQIKVLGPGLKRKIEVEVPALTLTFQTGPPKNLGNRKKPAH